MMHRVQRVVVNVPLSKEEELFKFVEEKSKGLGIICILLSDIVFEERFYESLHSYFICLNKHLELFCRSFVDFFEIACLHKHDVRK